MHTNNIRAIALFSGGLDSMLAAKLVMLQEVTVEAVNFTTGFYAASKDSKGRLSSRSAAERLGTEFTQIDISREILDIVKSPRHGWGSNMNPCIDCHILMLKKAGEYMRSVGASFLVTGEVVGERPMSQKKDMLRHIEKESGFQGLILRPLSAKLLEPTIPEKNGWVDRGKFLDIQGRSRKPQFQLAAELGIKDYAQPAGGCLLTDPGFAKRVKDLIEHDELTLENVNLLKIGRHFRVSKDAKAIAGRDEKENNALLSALKERDMVFKTARYPGPVVVGRGIFGAEHVGFLAGIAARYSDANGNPQIDVEYYRHPENIKAVVSVKKSSQELLDKMRI